MNNGLCLVAMFERAKYQLQPQKIFRIMMICSIRGQCNNLLKLDVWNVAHFSRLYSGRIVQLKIILTTDSKICIACSRY